MTIKIKALKQDDVTTTIDMVADDTHFWMEGTYLEYVIPSTGAAWPEDEQTISQNEGAYFCIISSTYGKSMENIFDFYGTADMCCCSNSGFYVKMPLFFIKDPDANK